MIPSVITTSRAGRPIECHIPRRLKSIWALPPQGPVATPDGATPEPQALPLGKLEGLDDLDGHWLASGDRRRERALLKPGLDCLEEDARSARILQDYAVDAAVSMNRILHQDYSCDAHLPPPFRRSRFVRLAGGSWS